MRFALLSVLATQAALTACVSIPTRTDGGDLTLVACGAFKPITYATEADPAASDTDDTILQIREHNAVWDRLCGGVNQR